MSKSNQQPSGSPLASPHCSAVVVNLKMEGSKRNRAKVQRVIESAINATLEDMTWHFTGKGTVEVEWEISTHNNKVSHTAGRTTENV